MTGTDRVPPLSTRLGGVLRPAVIAVSWLALVGLATGCFFAPRGAEMPPTMDDVIGFGGSTAIAAAAAAVAAFATGGRSRWAAETALVVVLLAATGAVVLVYLLWGDPTWLRGHMDFWSFDRLQQAASRWAEQLAGYHGPLCAAVGGALGAVAGLLLRLGRRRPRLAVTVGMCALFGLASESGRALALGVAAGLGGTPRYRFVRGTISDESIAVTGMLLGAVAGAAVAGVALYATRPRPGVVAALVAGDEPSGPSPD